MGPIGARRISSKPTFQLPGVLTQQYVLLDLLIHMLVLLVIGFIGFLQTIEMVGSGESEILTPRNQLFLPPKQQWKYVNPLESRECQSGVKFGVAATYKNGHGDS